MNKKMRNQCVGGRSLFYHRDSTGRHDHTPGQQTTNCQGASADEEIKTAFALLEKLDRYSESAGDYCGMRKVFELTNLKLFLRFEAAEWGKRTVQRLASGTITLGETPPPVQIYQGNTGRSGLKEALGQKHATATVAVAIPPTGRTTR
jgi:hypothetical protein